MRLLLEIIVIAALIALSWNKSFKDWASEAPIVGPYLSASAHPPTRNTKTTAAPASSATPPKSFTGHIYYTDEHGKSYWLDAQGQRHYQP
ncbi:MAG: hypothetical protein QOH88_3035 [Verrucomicrobiota bacterium]|jgi:hypothetical protein